MKTQLLLIAVLGVMALIGSEIRDASHTKPHRSQVRQIQFAALNGTELNGTFIETEATLPHFEPENGTQLNGTFIETEATSPHFEPENGTLLNGTAIF